MFLSTRDGTCPALAAEPPRLKNALAADRRHLPRASSAFFSAAILFLRILQILRAAGSSPSRRREQKENAPDCEQVR